MIGEKFKETLIKTSKTKKTKLIFALDKIKKGKRFITEEEIISLTKTVGNYVAAIKIGHPLTMRFGVKIADKLKETVGAPIIGDFKLADIGNTNRLITELAFENGVDAVITHLFVGPDAVEPILEKAEEYGDRGVIGLPTMSHVGAEMFLGKHRDELLKIAVELGLTGVIAPATRPSEIRYIRGKIGEGKLILAPGVGAQGGRVKDALENGADFVIVGRSIYESENPKKIAEKIANETWK